MYNRAMRTTITLDEDVREFTSVYSRARGMTLSAAINELIRKAEDAPAKKPDLIWSEDGVPMFPPSGRVLTTEIVKRLEEQEFDPKKFA